MNKTSTDNELNSSESFCDLEEIPFPLKVSVKFKGQDFVTINFNVDRVREQLDNFNLNKKINL